MTKRPIQKIPQPFWETKDLREMKKEEWESLCDHCGRCCLNKLECDETKQIYFTNAACKLLDLETGKCTNYRNRKTHVPDCINLTSGVVKRMNYLPETCAYRLLAEGKPLYDWHPLISGSPQSVIDAGISVITHEIINEDDVDDLDDTIIDWMPPIKKKTVRTIRKPQ